jgi:hypothetical protein
MMNRYHLTAVCVALATALLCGPMSYASTTNIWMTATAEDFARGKLEQVAILSTGQLAPGVGTTRFPMEEISIWSTAFMEDGTAYIGTGNNGLVYRIKKGGVEKAFETGEAVVTSLVRAGRTLYAGTMPDGKIFSWKEGGKPQLVADLDVPYIWDMMYHEGRKTLFVGTGPEGQVLTVTPRGKTEIFFDSNESHVLSLVEGPDGSVFAGTSMRGVIFQFSADGKVTGTWDLEDNEVRALAFRNGSLYIGANKIRSYEAGIYFMGERDYMQDRSQFAMLLAARIGQLQKGEEAVEKSFQELFDAAIYRLTPERDLHRILQIKSRYVCDIGVDSSEVIYAATADEGELWAASEPNLGWVMMDLKEAQILSLGIQKDELRQVATANAAAVYRTSRAAAKTMQFTSEVKDTGFRSSWGQIEWKSTAPIEVLTRTGSQSIPDDTWSDWSKPLTKSGQRITSPNARFIQFRARWKKGSDARVDWVRLAYINENQRPRIESLLTGRLQDVLPATKGAPPKLEQGHYKRMLDEAKGKVRIEWKASDPDGDKLLYWLYYRREGDKEWVIINPKAPVQERFEYYDLGSVTRLKKERSSPRSRMYRYSYDRETSFEWRTHNLADGWYMIKLVASDERDNAENPKKVWKEVGPILVDNRKPDVAELKESGKLTWIGKATDTTSHIARVEYNLDGEKWEILKAKDGIYDNQEEEFKIELKTVTPGEHVLTVRAFDEGGNIGMRQVGFTYPPKE